MNNLTFKQYRNIDLCIFSVMLAVSEAITTLATNVWFGAQPIAMSTTLLFICMIMMRWSWLAFIPACLGGAVFCITSGASREQFIVYIVGNCFALLCLIWFKFFKKEEIRKSVFKLMLFVLSAYLSMQLGRWIVSLPLGGRPIDLLLFITTDIISLLFAVVVMLLMRKTDGMIEDQKAYLLRLQREREENANAKGYN